MEQKIEDKMADIMKWASRNMDIDMSDTLQHKDGTYFKMLTIAVTEKLKNSPDLTLVSLGGHYVEAMNAYMAGAGWECNTVQTWVHRSEREVQLEFKFTKDVKGGD